MGLKVILIPPNASLSMQCWLGHHMAVLLFSFAPFPSSDPRPECSFHSQLFISSSVDGIGDEGARALAEAVKASSTLRSLTLEGVNVLDDLQ